MIARFFVIIVTFPTVCTPQSTGSKPKHPQLTVHVEELVIVVRRACDAVHKLETVGEDALFGIPVLCQRLSYLQINLDAFHG